MKIFKLLLFVALVFAAQAQAQNAPPPEPPQLKTAAENRYKLVAGDVLDVIYRYTPEFNQTVSIQPDGFVVLEIAGDIRLAGLTLTEAKQKIVENASKRLKDPEVTLLLKEFQKPFFVVAGEVLQPGRFEMRENVTALQAVMLAGGFKDSAKVSQVLIYRKINAETAEVKLLNLKNVRKTADLEQDFALENGDMILVPRNKITKFERYVQFANVASIFNPLVTLVNNNRRNR